MTAAGRAYRAFVIVLVVVLLPALAAGQTRPAQPPPPGSGARPILIRDLAVQGNRRVQEALILGRIRSVVGVPFNPSQASDDVRSIFTLGFFDDVQLKVEDFEGGVKLTFVVVERPFVRDVEFIGNSRLDTTALQEKIDLKLGSVYNPVDVERAKEKIKEAYEDEGYFEVQISSAVEKFGDGDVKVIFTVNEGRRITIEKIAFRGNKGLTDSQIKDVMITKERQLFILRGTVQRQKLEEDVERIVGLYQDHGYVQMRVERYDTSVNRETARVTVTFDIVEGAQYRVGTIKFTGLNLFPEAEIRRQLRFKTGDVFSRSELRDTVRGITDLYSTIGHASAEVIPRTDQQPATLTMDVTIEVNEGPEVYVERINISGNTRSEDRILRREIEKIYPGFFAVPGKEKA